MTTEEFDAPARGTRVTGVERTTCLRALIACLVRGYNNGKGGRYYAIRTCVKQRTDHPTR